MQPVDKRNYNAFLILGISSGMIVPGKMLPIKRFPDIFDGKEASYSLVLINDKRHSDTLEARVLIETSPKRETTLAEGLELMHGFQTLLAIHHFCITRVAYEYSLLPVTNSLLETVPPWSLQAIEANCREEIEYCYGYVDDFRVAFGTKAIEPVDEFEFLMPFLAGYIEFPDVRRACSYLFSSMKELGWDVCDWRDEYYAEDANKFTTIGSAEASFLAAYKCIEALIGEPSKNRTEIKLKAHLNALGVNPSEPVGYRDREPILSKILRYHPLRDSTAAHGSGSRKQPLKLGQIVDLQALARYVLLQTIEYREKIELDVA